MAACMNAACGAAAPGGEWRKGWALRSGGFAMLCDKCGTAFEQLIFCYLFHQKESGWRECIFCGKRLHCGCIASKSSIDLLDGGGVQCIGCMKNPKPSLCPRVVSSLRARSPKDENASEFGASLEGSTCKLESSFADYKMDVDAIAKGKVVQLGMNNEDNGHITMFRAQKENYSSSGSFSHVNGEQAPHIGSPSFLKRDPDCVPSSHISQQDDSKDASKDSVICEPLARAYLSISSGNPNPGASIEVISSGPNPEVVPPLSNAVEGSDQNRTFSAFSQVQRTHQLLAKPQNSGLCSASETSKEVVSHVRVARPPGEGRGRNQLLPRYWPRFTGQELQKIYGDSNATIVPLFEKVLSASDAGRIGRLVLPKACAEAYFPPISQPEGLPLTLQDSRGKNWHFQFRFWPNNNSRMYVLEGVTPCIQSLQLQAGDTVTFSRIEPEGKLVMGYRKATTSVTLQDSQISSTANGTLGSGSLFSTVNENLSTVSGYSGLLQSLKGFANSNLSCLSERLNPADGDISWKKTDKQGGIPEAFVWQPSLVMEKKRSRNIGSKSKRLHIDKEDALELKLSWEEAQDLLRPPPSVKPSIVVIEDHEFEEYDEPPVFGKRAIFTTQPFGGQDQWIQCDDCFKWRRLSVDVLPPPKWTCSDNISDPRRSLCSTPNELNPKELQNLLRQDADRKRRKITGSSSTQIPRIEAYGLDALANAAALGDAENRTMPTTKHPRHRPGCTCIVCIQPPSGKGPKHDPACTCNVCLTVKRRFKTLTMRKKQRQSEREEAEANHKKPAWGEMETDGDFKIEQIELNCQPGRVVSAPPRVSMMSLLEVASRPLEDYLRQNGLSRLAEGGADEGSDTPGNDIA